MRRRNSQPRSAGLQRASRPQSAGLQRASRPRSAGLQQQSARLRRQSGGRCCSAWMTRPGQDKAAAKNAHQLRKGAHAFMVMLGVLPMLLLTPTLLPAVPEQWSAWAAVVVTVVVVLVSRVT